MMQPWDHLLNHHIMVLQKSCWILSRVPGGSSGGSAAAVAADMCLFALGTDTGGSVRQPAAFCGVVGMYPTYGSVSRYGAIAMGSSLDQIGPFGKNINDAKIVYETITGYDEMDATSIATETRNNLVEKTSMKKVIGVPRKFVDMEGISPEVKKNFEESLERLKKAGYEIRDIELPNAHLGSGSVLHYYACRGFIEPCSV
jgi:aspartyl-tRNA(Asn)/glutamyl-tRNA(Gln) amidotransferase subunit A